VEYFARISHRSEEQQTEDSWERFLTSVVLKHGDWSVTEHVNVSVDAVVDRGIMAEWTRHRLGAYTVESTRFVRYGAKRNLCFIEPIGLYDGGLSAWAGAMQEAEIAYDVMLESGETPQIARSVLPMSLATRMAVTYNLRNWRHFFLMRTSREAHPQMREVTIPLLAQFQERIPLLFDDIFPNEPQVHNLSKPR
jgi:thymidylate synthase (FAD)